MLSGNQEIDDPNTTTTLQSKKISDSLNTQEATGLLLSNLFLLLYISLTELTGRHIYDDGVATEGSEFDNQKALQKSIADGARNYGLLTSLVVSLGFSIAWIGLLRYKQKELSKEHYDEQKKKQEDTGKDEVDPDQEIKMFDEGAYYDQFKNTPNAWYRRCKDGVFLGNNIGQLITEVLFLALGFVLPVPLFQALERTIKGPIKVGFSALFGLLCGVMAVLFFSSGPNLTKKIEEFNFSIGRDGWTRYTKGGLSLGNAIGGMIGALIGFFIPIPGGVVAGIAIGAALGGVLGFVISAAGVPLAKWLSAFFSKVKKYQVIKDKIIDEEMEEDKIYIRHAKNSGGKNVIKYKIKTDGKIRKDTIRYRKNQSAMDLEHPEGQPDLHNEDIKKKIIDIISKRPKYQVVVKDEEVMEGNNKEIKDYKIYVWHAKDSDDNKVIKYRIKTDNEIRTEIITYGKKPLDPKEQSNIDFDYKKKQPLQLSDPETQEKIIGIISKRPWQIEAQTIADSKERTKYFRSGAAVGIVLGAVIGLALCFIPVIGTVVGIPFMIAVGSGVFGIAVSVLMATLGPKLQRKISPNDQTYNSFDYGTATGLSSGQTVGNLFAGFSKWSSVSDKINDRLNVSHYKNDGYTFDSVKSLTNDMALNITGLIGGLIGAGYDIYTAWRQNRILEDRLKKNSELRAQGLSNITDEEIRHQVTYEFKSNQPAAPWSQRLGLFITIGRAAGGFLGVIIGGVIGGPIGAGIGFAIGVGGMSMIGAIVGIAAGETICTKIINNMEAWVKEKWNWGVIKSPAPSTVVSGEVGSARSKLTSSNEFSPRGNDNNLLEKIVKAIVEGQKEALDKLLNPHVSGLLSKAIGSSSLKAWGYTGSEKDLSPIQLAYILAHVPMCQVMLGYIHSANSANGAGGGVEEALRQINEVQQQADAKLESVNEFIKFITPFKNEDKVPEAKRDEVEQLIKKLPPCYQRAIKNSPRPDTWGNAISKLYADNAAEFKELKEAKDSFTPRENNEEEATRVYLENACQEPGCWQLSSSKDEGAIPLATRATSSASIFAFFSPNSGRDEPENLTVTSLTLARNKI